MAGFEVWPAAAPAGDADAALAARHAPILVATADEPYPPLVYGFTVRRDPGPSLSSKFALQPRAAALIEYAVWYDYDIGHLYDLEHVWVDLDAADAVVAVDASRHGKRIEMTGCAIEDGHPVLAIETGKHAHWPSAEAMAPAYAAITLACGARAGEEGVHLGNPFAEAGLYRASEAEHTAARRRMLADRLTPDFTRWQRFTPATIRLAPWPNLAAWIPGRVRRLVATAVAEFG